MVVLYQYAIAEVKTVIVSPSHAHGVLFQRSQAGGRLAGIGDDDIEPLHFGILATVNLAIGYVTPPYGATLFVACGISGQNVRAVTSRIVPILIAMLLVLLVVTYWPDTVLWLPRLAAP